MAEASRASWFGQPSHLRVCAHCTRKLTLREGPRGLWFDTFNLTDGWPTVYHGSCWKFARKKARLAWRG